MVKSTLGGGHQAGYPAALAHGAGVGLYGLLTVTGLAVLITRSPGVFLALQVAGAFYLLYLGLKSLQSSSASGLLATTSTNGRSAALEGFLVAFLNPKLAVFMLALFSQFLQPDTGTAQKAIMVATVGITDACWYMLVVALLSRKTFLDKLRRSATTIDRVFGAILIVLALSVLGNALL